MKIISLSFDEAGYACAIASSIKKYFYNNNCKTNFFDYLVVSMKSINEILELKNLNLLINNLDLSESHIDTTIVKWSNFHKLISYHDIKNNSDKSDLIHFKNKYLRRYIRLIHYLYEENIIFFIRYGKTPENDIQQFFKNIKNINNNLIFYFINVDYDTQFKENIQYKNIENYIYINFYLINNNNTKHTDKYFEILEYNWDFVFNLIKKNNDYILNNN